ncbi:PREDICTED: uncharacterized protein LOC106113535 isoform X3 [Papilio xuthus]|uniref:Uncharacterized protein LOC106113535 isoform X3 n=1 Tax=Papilio xuthus TaxID=66420 RepID=A0AAJ6YYZ0_PAPXU|nr:PREDICTED: uncharacterized protein LOC106113535 isoform X3 [Papilio xuthus]
MAQLDVLIRKRSGMKAKLTNFSNYINSISASGIISELQHELQCRLNKYEALYDQFDELQVEIEVCSDKPEDEYEERSKFEERYYALMAQARSLLCREGATDDGRSVAGSICKQAAMVKVIDDNGNSMDARLLLDNGSTANFITQSLCSKLKLPTRSVSSEINGINNQSLPSTQACNLTIQSQCCRYRTNIDCYILPEITKILPSTLIDVSQLSMPADLHLADPTFNIPSVVDILVGAEVFWDVICNKSINLGKNKPKLVKSKLGWIVTGQLPIQSSSKFTHSCNLSIRNLDNNLKRVCHLPNPLAITTHHNY